MAEDIRPRLIDILGLDAGVLDGWVTEACTPRRVRQPSRHSQILTLRGTAEYAAFLDEIVKRWGALDRSDLVDVAVHEFWYGHFPFIRYCDRLGRETDPHRPERRRILREIEERQIERVRMAMTPEAFAKWQQHVNEGCS
jgi:hypothetical protein